LLLEVLSMMNPLVPLVPVPTCRLAETFGFWLVGALVTVKE
jgi:hypothetical protein